MVRVHFLYCAKVRVEVLFCDSGMPEKRFKMHCIKAFLRVGKNGGLGAHIKMINFKMCACSALIIIRGASRK